MGSIPIGPVIEFRFSQPYLQGSTIPALQQVREQAKTVSNQIADDWKRMAAQIRASMAQGLGPRRKVAQRTQLISILDQEISGLRKRNELTVKELSSFRAMTLERERQADAIRTGTVGVTAGTTAALGQAHQQVILVSGRVLDSLGKPLSRRCRRRGFPYRARRSILLGAGWWEHGHRRWNSRRPRRYHFRDSRWRSCRRRSDGCVCRSRHSRHYSYKESR